jgi:acetamidase/formamidase
MADGTVLTLAQRAVPLGGPLVEANPVAGPIAVVGADLGDAVATTIESVTIDRATGRTLLAPDHGLLTSQQAGGGETVPAQMFEWRVDADSRRARLSNAIGSDAIDIAIKPFVGCIGVCPEEGREVATLYAGTHGGNMDLPTIAPGTTLYLPVFHPCGLVMLGDLHAAQGHGEAMGGGIECCGTVELTTRTIRDWPLQSPALKTNDEIGAIASHADVRIAIQLAYARLLDWMSMRLGMNRFDAYALLTHVARVELGNLVMPPYSVAVLCPIELLPASALKLLEETS